MMPPIVAALAAFLLLSLVAPDASAGSARGFGARAAGATFVHPGRWQRPFVHSFDRRGRRVGWRHRRFIPSFGLPVLTSAFATPGFGGFTPEDLGPHTVPAVAGIRAAPVGVPTIYVVEPGRRSALSPRRRAATPRAEAEADDGDDRFDGPRVITAPRHLPPPSGPLIVRVP